MARTLVCALVGWMAVASAAGGAGPRSARQRRAAAVAARAGRGVREARGLRGTALRLRRPRAASAFAASVVRPGATRAVIRERDRIALPGTLPGDGFELTVEAFVESDREARLHTWSLDVKRVGGRAQAPGAPAASAWVIAGQRDPRHAARDPPPAARRAAAVQRPPDRDRGRGLRDHDSPGRHLRRRGRRDADGARRPGPRPDAIRAHAAGRTRPGEAVRRQRRH